VSCSSLEFLNNLREYEEDRFAAELLLMSGKYAMTTLGVFYVVYGHLSVFIEPGWHYPVTIVVAKKECKRTV
jgi:hypothetical protein